MDNVVAIRPPVDEDTVNILRRALEQAESGEMTGVVLIGEMRGNEICNAGTFDNGTALLGNLAHMMFHISAAMRGE